MKIKAKANNATTSPTHPIVIDALCEKFEPYATICRRNDELNPPVYECQAVWPYTSPLGLFLLAREWLWRTHRLLAYEGDRPGFRVLRWMMPVERKAVGK